MKTNIYKNTSLDKAVKARLFNMTKILSLIVVLALLIAIVSCKGPSVPQVNQPEKTVEETPVSVTSNVAAIDKDLQEVEQADQELNLQDLENLDKDLQDLNNLVE